MRRGDRGEKLVGMDDCNSSGAAGPSCVERASAQTRKATVGILEKTYVR